MKHFLSELSILGSEQQGSTVVDHQTNDSKVKAGNTKGESITVPLTSCLTGLEFAV
jgi:hypothetical protein